MLTHIRIFSDIHLEFDLLERRYETHTQLWQPEPLPEDKRTILLLAGDVWVKGKQYAKPLNGGPSWVEAMAQRFGHIIIVHGNHDYWGLSIESATRKAKKHCANMSNVTFLEQGRTWLNGADIKIVGATLWTDFDKANPLVMFDAKSFMNDYRKVMVGDTNIRRRLKPKDILDIHTQSKQHIFEHAKTDFKGQKVIVMTHMAPSRQSLSKQHAGNRLNALYATELGYELMEHLPKLNLWVHGHIHDAVDYHIGVTRVLSNPRGYVGYDTNVGFNPLQQLKISDL